MSHICISKWKLCQFESIGGKTNLSLKLHDWDRVQKNALHLLKRRWNPVDNDLPQLSLDQEHQHERHSMSKQVRSKNDQVKEWKIFFGYTSCMSFISSLMFEALLGALNIYVAKKPWKCFLSTFIIFRKPFDPQKTFTLIPYHTEMKRFQKMKHRFYVSFSYCLMHVANRYYQYNN